MKDLKLELLILILIAENYLPYFDFQLNSSVVKSASCDQVYHEF